MSKKEKKVQVVIEETVALIIIFMLMVAATKLFLWFSDNLAARHKKFEATRTIGGSVEEMLYGPRCEIIVEWDSNDCDPGFWKLKSLTCWEQGGPDINLKALWGSDLYSTTSNGTIKFNPAYFSFTYEPGMDYQDLVDSGNVLQDPLNDDKYYVLIDESFTTSGGDPIINAIVAKVLLDDISPEQVQDLDYSPDSDGPGELHLVD